MYNKLLLIDGSYYLNRALSVDRFWNMTYEGKRVGGIYGFLRSLQSTLDISDYYPVVVFDKGISKHRVRLYSEYKHNNEREVAQLTELTEEEQFNNFGIQLKKQRNVLEYVLRSLGIPVISIDGYEGDDLIYYTHNLCRYSIICSEDRDMWQMIGDRCFVYLPKQKTLMDKTLLSEKYGYESAEQFLLEKIILGDSSDNIPSCCNGVGEKSVKDLERCLGLFKFSLLSDEYRIEFFPKTESGLVELFEKHSIPYKKSFNNFSPKQFKINEELINLNRLPSNKQVENLITANIDCCRTSIDAKEALDILRQYNITDIDTIKIASVVSSKYINLFQRNSLF